MKTRKNIANTRIIAPGGHAVKARIIAAGLKLGVVARAARISQSALSNYLNGSRGDRATQLKIWDAYHRLTGDDVSLADFWGDLLSERMRA